MNLHLGSIFLVVSYLSILISPGQGQDGREIEVTVPQLGTLQGSILSTTPESSPASRTYFSFAGIPYADPSSYTKNNRFKPSTIWAEPLPKNEDGKFMATSTLIRCPQVDVLNKSDTTDLKQILPAWGKRKRDETFMTAQPEIRGEEDCLVLNVNTPKLPVDPNNPSELLPVIVFIHGGSWAGLWGGIFGGERFLKHDVLFVTINYRLGILGSLNLGIDDAPGNAAMYDIITALKWVKQHIRYFGGDNRRITVTGQSAGAMLASHLLTSPLIYDETDRQPLIHGMIGLSGNSLSPIATCTDPMTHHLRISNISGCYDGVTVNPDLNIIRQCMANKPIPDLIEAMAEYSRLERYEAKFGMDARVPSLQDPLKLTVPVFMSETPYQVMQQSKQLDIPVMMGTTRHDGGFLLEDTYLQFIKPHNYTNNPLYLKNEMLQDLMQGLGRFKVPYAAKVFTNSKLVSNPPNTVSIFGFTTGLQDASGELYHSLGKIYLGDAMYTDDLRSKIPGLLDIHSVFVFKASAYQLVEMHSKNKMHPNSYYFSFEHSGLWTLDGGLVAPGGIGHIDSLFYLFKVYPLTFPMDLQVSERFLNYWINFAMFGNPNGNSKATVAAPYNSINHAYLVIRGLFDWTGYYCRDRWINNSLELVEESASPSTPSPTASTSTTPQQSTTDSESIANAKMANVAVVLAAYFSVLVFKYIA